MLKKMLFKVTVMSVECGEWIASQFEIKTHITGFLGDSRVSVDYL